MVPLSTHLLQAQNLSREYAMFAQGRYIAQARGEQVRSSSRFPLRLTESALVYIASV